MREEMWLRADTEGAIHGALDLMGLSQDGGLVAGCGAVLWPVGSILDGAQPNTQVWANLILYAPLTPEDCEASRSAFRDGASQDTKPSENGEGPSVWSLRPDSSALFEESYLGKPHPENPRMRWAV